MNLNDAKKIYGQVSRTYKEAILFLELNEQRIRLEDVILLIHLKNVAEGKSISEIVEHRMKCDLGNEKRTEKLRNNFKVKISIQMKRYVDNNIIKLKQDPNDKRTKIVMFTKFGNEILEKLNKKAEEIWKENYE